MKVRNKFKLRAFVRWVLAVVLIWAAASKLADAPDFLASLKAYELPLPDRLLRLMAAVLPWLELVGGALLVIGVMRRVALILAAVLFALFMLATGQAWVRGLDISCGCLDLGFLGIGPGTAVAHLLESVRFAFFRALVLEVAALYLLRPEAHRAAAATP